MMPGVGWPNFIRQAPTVKLASFQRDNGRRAEAAIRVAYMARVPRQLVSNTHTESKAPPLGVPGQPDPLQQAGEFLKDKAYPLSVNPPLRSNVFFP